MSGGSARPFGAGGIGADLRKANTLEDERFRFVITITLGSTFASVLLSKDVPLAEGLTASAVLIVIQFIVAWLSDRSSFVCRWVLAIQTKYEAPDVKRRREPSRATHTESSQVNLIFDGVLTLITIDSSMAAGVQARFFAPFPAIGIPRSRERKAGAGCK